MKTNSAASQLMKPHQNHPFTFFSEWRSSRWSHICSNKDRYLFSFSKLPWYLSFGQTWCSFWMCVDYMPFQPGPCFRWKENVGWRLILPEWVFFFPLIFFSFLLHSPSHSKLSHKIREIQSASQSQTRPDREGNPHPSESGQGYKSRIGALLSLHQNHEAKQKRH